MNKEDDMISLSIEKQQDKGSHQSRTFSRRMKRERGWRFGDFPGKNNGERAMKMGRQL